MSIWTETVRLPRFECLPGDIRVDVLVVGGGMAGLLCAYKLKEAGIRCALVEAGRICGGITKDTTAKITFHHRLIYHKLIGSLGTERAAMYLDANRAALEEYRGLCGKIACDYRERDSFVYSRGDQAVIRQELDALEKLGIRAEYAEPAALPFPTAGAVKVEGQAEFHPLKFAAGIARGLTIYENTCVRELAPRRAVTDRGVITADQIVIAAHFPFLNRHGGYFFKMYQERSYVIALKGAGKVNGMYADESEKGLSFRDAGDLLLVGGGSRRTGKPGEGWSLLDRFASQYYPAAQKVSQWAAQDCMTLDHIPYIGPYSGRTQGLFVASGFNKWGMTASMAAAGILTDQIAGRKNPWAPVFSPSRGVLRPQLAVNGLEAAAAFLTPSGKRCTHMGCALKWNGQEGSWDCPCHGSRFTRQGELIDNPAMKNLNGPVPTK